MTSLHQESVRNLPTLESKSDKDQTYADIRASDHSANNVELSGWKTSES
jgi:hypothetical protein